ncbi:MAG TPA: hypothetical protein VFR90_07195 [Methylibium sp.]|uniref:hypothetical protein n=1 Tax=Methylibium sp. TaxID=2067992 RepID=UPI002DBEC4DA|nr:hypothetical protein [Methylibium sp.]HEU4458893.1 hypothetical protein [Methylibium sp.]
MPVRRLLLALLAPLPILASCGGGVSIGIGCCDDDDPPSVALAASTDAARPGEAVQLTTAVSDDYGLDRVEFYRLDPGGTVFLGADGLFPFSFSTAVPANAPVGGTLQFFARAVDGADQAADSRAVAVTVLP